MTGRRQTAAPPWAPRRAHGGWHRHGFAEIGQTGAAIGPGIEPRIRRQSTGAKLVEGGKAGLAKDRPEIGIAGEEVGFDGGKTAGEFRGDGVDALIFQIDQVIHFYTIDTAEVRFLYSSDTSINRDNN